MFNKKKTTPVAEEEDVAALGVTADQSETAAAVTAAAGGEVGGPMLSARAREIAAYVAWGIAAAIVVIMLLAFVGVDLGWMTELGNSMLDQALDPQTAAVAVAVIGLNIHFGYTGLLNMGQAGFMLLGAYGFAISIVEGCRCCPRSPSGWSPPACSPWSSASPR